MFYKTLDKYKKNRYIYSKETTIIKGENNE